MEFNEYAEAAALGVIQGIAEFLPISSSGHLVILQHPIRAILGMQPDQVGLELNIALHLGTLFSILLVFRTTLRDLLRQPKLVLAIVAATIPIVFVGLFLKDTVEALFESPLFAGCGLFVTGILLFVSQSLHRGDDPLETVDNKRGLLIGLFQAVAIIPGISRSGSTISGGLLLGLDRHASATFSFLIAIPAIGGASVLLLKDLIENESTRAHLGPLVVGGLVSFAVGCFSLNWLMKIVVARRLHWFAIYCFLMGAVGVAIGWAE